MSNVQHAVKPYRHGLNASRSVEIVCFPLANVGPQVHDCLTTHCVPPSAELIVDVASPVWFADLPR